MSNPNDYIKQKERGLKRKLELIKEKGGKCEICGYDKNIAALDFHHVDPSNKSFQLDSRHLSNTAPDKLLEEANKCILICANCHREIHHKNLDKNNIEILLNEITSEYHGLRHNNKTSICKHCGKEFQYSKGKIYCSKECREKDRNYPTHEEIVAKYKELGSIYKTAEFFHMAKRTIKKLLEIKKN